jgi:hypothetical protein
MRPSTSPALRRLVAARRRIRSSIRIESDGRPLRAEAVPARDELLHAVEASPSTVRRSVIVTIANGRIYAVTTTGWRVRFELRNEIIRAIVVASPPGQEGRRRALRADPRYHRLEASEWLRWIVATVASTEPAWLTRASFTERLYSAPRKVV